MSKPAQLTLIALFIEAPEKVGADGAESKLAEEAGDELMTTHFVHLKHFTPQFHAPIKPSDA